MAEKELRREIEELAVELDEIRKELGGRIAGLKKKIKPVVLVVVGLIAIKIGLKIAKAMLGLVWKMKSFLMAGIILVGLKLYMATNKEH